MTSENQNSTQATGKPQNGKAVVLAAWGCVILGFGVAIPALVQTWHDGFSLGNYSNLGSYLQGSVASLFSLGGMLFIYASFRAQQKQIEQQDQQQEDQREHFEKQLKLQEMEVKDQKRQFEAQQNSIKQQVFESSFFQMLHLQNEITMALQDQPDHYTTKRHGRECFELWHNQLYEDYQKQKIIVSDDERTHVTKAYSIFYKRKQPLLSHYCRNLYHIFKFVDEATTIAEYKDKRRYTSLVRAQLSAYELPLLFYNGLIPFPAGQTNKFKPLIEKFGLFEHIDENLLFDKSHKEEDFYAPSAYK